MKSHLRACVVTLTLIFSMSIVAFADKDVPIQVSELPASAQYTLSTYFGGLSIALAKMESDLFSKSYDIIFTNGDKIEFDSSGNWTDIKCKATKVPSALVPKQILSYINTNYPGNNILEIEREKKEIEVKLSNGLELTFNAKFQLIEIDN